MNAVESLVSDVVVKFVGQCDVLAAVETHVGHVDEHHVHLLKGDGLTLGEVKQGEDTVV